MLLKPLLKLVKSTQNRKTRKKNIKVWRRNSPQLWRNSAQLRRNFPYPQIIKILSRTWWKKVGFWLDLGWRWVQRRLSEGLTSLETALWLWRMTLPTKRWLLKGTDWWCLTWIGNTVPLWILSFEKIFLIVYWWKNDFHCLSLGSED